VNDPLLQVEDIHTYYGSACILDGVTFDVSRASCVGILGRNGVGKTTLARSIIGFTPPARGDIFFNGVRISGRPAREIVRRGIAIVPQGRRVFPSLTVDENLRVAARRHRGTDVPARWTGARVYELFPRLLERRRQWAQTLSGGEQQMLAIGRALMTCPTLLILDEPTEGLAPIIIEDLVKAILQLKDAGVSLLLLEQRVEIALRLADTALLMTSRGAISFRGKSSDFPTHDVSLGLVPSSSEPKV
jgi:branched-chain amino acid transport system ATP-binding protein